MPIVRPTWYRLLTNGTSKIVGFWHPKSSWLKLSTLCSLALALVIVIDLSRDGKLPEPDRSEINTWSSPELLDQSADVYEIVTASNDVDASARLANHNATAESTKTFSDRKLTHASYTQTGTTQDTAAAGREELKIIQTGFETVEAQPARAVWLTGIIEEVTD